MIELPEATVVTQQIAETLTGKRIASAVAGASPHKFAWYSGDPATYNDRLAGKVLGAGAEGFGGYIVFTAGDMQLAISAPVRYHAAGKKRPKKHQLLLAFEDGTAITASAQMWGGFLCFPIGDPDGYPEHYADAQTRPSPLTDDFDRDYFDTLFDAETPKLSAKGFLATEQRIPGLGNGVLQDILWTARVHPKRKMGDLSDDEIQSMFEAVRQVLGEMTAQGGRNTERDLFGAYGGYATVLSRKSLGAPCPTCGTPIKKQSYLGGAIYVCEGCQLL